MSSGFRVLEVCCVASGEVRLGHIKHALSLGLPVCVLEKEHDRVVACVGAGPSVRNHLQELRDFPGEVWAINGAHNFLIENGVNVSGCVLLDPEAQLVEYLKKPNASVTYYVASVCHPEVFSALDGFDVRVWHAWLEESMPPSGSYAVPGASTCLTRAPFLAHMLGYRDIRIFGADSSYEEVTHCYGDSIVDTGVDHTREIVRVGDQLFATEVKLMQQVTEMRVIAEHFPAKISFHCGGLMRAFLDAPLENTDDAIKRATA